jgi:hypothetical protein
MWNGLHIGTNFTTPSAINPMQHMIITGSYPVRKNTTMRSLIISYPRIQENAKVKAALSDLYHSEARFQLQVLAANSNGIAVKLPALLSGMYDLVIQDGDNQIIKRIALQ